MGLSPARCGLSPLSQKTTQLTLQKTFASSCHSQPPYHSERFSSAIANSLGTAFDLHKALGNLLPVFLRSTNKTPGPACSAGPGRLLFLVYFLSESICPCPKKNSNAFRFGAGHRGFVLFRRKSNPTHRAAGAIQAAHWQVLSRFDQFHPASADHQERSSRSRVPFQIPIRPYWSKPKDFL